MTDNLDPIIKRLELAVSPAKAFRHFTANIAVWWPLGTHSLSLADASSVTFEAREGGRIYETDKDGQEREWGIVLECEENALLRFSWVLEQPELATEVEVTFESHKEGGCVMTLTHRGWDQRPNGAEWRANYNSGWDGVLGEFSNSVA